MEDFFIPRLHSLAMNNVFTGSKGNFRFRIEPAITKKPKSKEVDFDASFLKAECWHGPFCYEKSTMEDEKIFPLSEEGRQDMIDWLLAHI